MMQSLKYPPKILICMDNVLFQIAGSLGNLGPTCDRSQGLPQRIKPRITVTLFGQGMAERVAPQTALHARRDRPHVK
ncbi:hypothetical protein [Pseudoprimorskyibacter insulae]|uniref:Uncharacterized protein n=1 Tax=Pseudoprimorskyibacter insulae TaxID=1695997 RepID=A0A2R8AW81_9RHOB|nr:hypothetical protein [Pseudoprimorskyibacter insulae]SPF80283.1 hypothetical protein PRI8871_02087 [Pseudoprimorskyibacter insulae]